MHWPHQWRVAVLVLALVVPPSVAFAQADRTPPPQPPQIDQAVINVPTTLSSPSPDSDVRLTHRFAQLDKRDTLFVGLGARVRSIAETTFRRPGHDRPWL